MAINRKLKLGCGAGCGVLLLAFLILLGGFIYFTKDMGRQYKAVRELEEQLAAAGGPSDSLPEGYLGRPTAARLEDFVTVRQRTQEWRDKTASTFTELLATDAEAEGLAETLRVLRATRDLAPVYAGFWTSRNQALLDLDMGMAEYIYLYHLSYFAWLGMDPADGAGDAARFMEGMGAQGVGAAERDADRHLWARREVQRLMLPLLEQLARRAQAGESAEELMWAERLRAEVHALQDDPERLPFADGLPAELVEVFAPYREALAATYNATVNPVELIFEDTWEEPE